MLLLFLWGTLVKMEDATSSTQDGTCSSNESAKNASICHDNHPAENECQFWARNGECEKNPNFMTKECKKSCGICSDNDGVHQGRENNKANNNCSDNKPGLNECPYWAKNGECENNPNFMTVECRKSCGICLDTGVDQTLESDVYQVTAAQTNRRLKEATAYVETIKPELNEICKNEHELCTVWAVIGECEKNEKCKYFWLKLIAGGI